MKKFFCFLFFVFLFLLSSSGVATSATVMGLTLSKEILVFLPKETSVSFQIFNNTDESQDYFLSLAPLVLDGGKYVESPTEKNFLDLLSISPGKVVKGLPPNQAQTITLRLGKPPAEDHQVVLFVRQALKRKSAEQIGKKTAGARNVPNVGIQVIFLAKKDAPKGILQFDLEKKRILITKKSRSFLYGELSVVGIDAEGKEEVLSKFNLFVRNDRWIDLPNFSKFGKIRIRYVECGKNIILDQTLSVLGKGFISFYGNNTLVSSDFPCFMKDNGAEVLVDVKEFASALGFYSEENKGVIRGTVFGKSQWFEINLNGTASNYNTLPFKLSSSFYGLLTVEELAKIFGLDVDYNRWELFLSVKTRERERFAFQIIDDLKSKMRTEQEPEKKGRNSATKIFCITADYSLYNQNNGNGNNTCGTRLNCAANISSFVFSGEQRIDSDGESQFANKQLAYFNEKFNFQTNLGEINRLSQSPFRQNTCGLGNGIEIFSLPADGKFPVKGKAILPAAKDDEIAGCWFSNNQYFDQNSTIFFHRGTNSILHHYLNKYGEEKRDYQFFAIPQNHPGEGKFSFYAGGLRGEDERYFYNFRLDYGLAKNAISVGKADEAYLSLVSPFQYFILDGIFELREKPKYRANLSTLNFTYGRLNFNASADEKTSLSLNWETRVGLLRIANNIKKEEKEIEDRFSFSFSPYRRVNCSADFLANKNSGLAESRYLASYSFRRHRLEASLQRNHIANSYFPRLGYDYRIGQLNFSLEFDGENFERIYCSVFYFFEYGQASQSSYYNTETNQWSADSSFSGSVIATNSNLNFCSESSMRQAKVFVLVFMDKNFNGVFDKKVDKPLKEARITVDGKPSQYSTSEKGSAWIKLSTPNKSLIGVDDASLPPQAFAGEPVLVKVFAPISMKVEIPVYLGGEIMGVEQGGAVEIYLLKNGVQIAKADVYSDGTFYFNKIIPGNYILVAGDRKKEVSIKIDEQGEPVSALDVVLEK